MADQEPEGRSAVSAAIRGDSEAVRAVWQANRRWVAAVILAHKPREAELEDLLQDVAMSFVRTIGTLRDEAMIRPWLRTVAMNAARAAGRETSRRRRHMGWKVSDGSTAQESEAGIGAGTGAAAGRGPDESVQRQEEAARLGTLASRLPEGYREPLLLKCVRGLSYRQIGELMGLPETTIETRIARGRKMLRELAIAEGVAGVVREGSSL